MISWDRAMISCVRDRLLNVTKTHRFSEVSFIVTNSHCLLLTRSKCSQVLARSQRSRSPLRSRSTPRSLPPLLRRAPDVPPASWTVPLTGMSVDDVSAD